MSTWHGVMGDGEEFMRWKISTKTVDGYKTDTKCAQSVHGRPTLKDEERFRNELFRKAYERSLYERTFMSVPFIEKHAISTKSHRVCRRDRASSRIPIRSLRSLRNKSRKVREFVYARILSRFPMSSTLYRYLLCTSSNHRLGSAGLNALEELLFRCWQ